MVNMNKKKKPMEPAARYACADDICIITSYFNPSGYRTKKENFERFIAPVKKAKLNYVVVECSFNGKGFELPESKNIIRVNAGTILWQKERLLNIALKHVPEKCTKIAWIDSDILFSNTNWAVETSHLLDKYKIIQPFEYAVRLPKGNSFTSDLNEVYTGFGYVYTKYPNSLLEGNFNLHGHTGFAWAGRKEVFERLGFYDACIAGSADHVMAHSFCGDWDSACLNKMFLDNGMYRNHYIKWSEKIYKKVKAKVSYTEGVVFHLWHGEIKHRRYLERMQYLNDYNFDPEKDLYLNETGCWEINESRAELIPLAGYYFAERKEDGE
jgi:hypothetical protein